jgi:hypothetical protein
MSVKKRFEGGKPHHGSSTYFCTSASSRLSHSKPVRPGANGLLKPAKTALASGECLRAFGPMESSREAMIPASIPGA